MADDNTPARTGSEPDNNSSDKSDTPDESGRTPDEQAEPNWKELAQQWEKRAKGNSQDAKEAKALRAELEKLQEAHKTEQEKAIDAARRAGREEAVKEWQPKHEGLIRRNTALQMLGGRVKAPALVLPHLGLDDIEVDDNGKVDETALKLAIERVLEEYPFLATDEPGSAPTHHGDLGARRNSKSGKHDPDELLRAAFRR